MSDDKLYVALREYARLAAETTAKMEVLKAIPEVRAALLAEIPKEGPPGKDGSNGVVGKDGRDGVDGKNGELGTRGTDGVNGRDGIDGKSGVDGKDGKDGEKGERGADGIATRAELDAWFEQRAADLEARSLADVFQGVYDQSKTYIRGMIAVWDGQPWLAMAETRAMPGVSSDWKLLVKKGRDGRDKSK